MKAMHLSRVLGAAMAIAMLAACSDDSAEPSRKGTLLLRNDANVPIETVEITGCLDPEWGPNRLGTGETIATGQIRSWKLDPGCYDVRASTSQKSGTWYDRHLAMGDTVRLALSPAANSAVVDAAGFHANDR